MPGLRLSLVALLLAALAQPALAAKGDRDKPLAIESERGGQVNMQTGRIEWDGPVLLSQGTLQLRAGKLEVEKRSDATVFALAGGRPGEPVRFVQARDVAGESIQGHAERIEYDSRAETVRFVGGATLRQLRGSDVLQEVTGAAIVYNSRSETFSVEPGQTSPQEAGKVRVLVMPRAASAAAAAGSAVPLQTAPALPRP